MMQCENFLKAVCPKINQTNIENNVDSKEEDIMALKDEVREIVKKNAKEKMDMLNI